jgi:hypothetical protein
MAATQGATSIYAKGRQTPSLQDKFQMTRRATVTQAAITAVQSPGNACVSNRRHSIPPPFRVRQKSNMALSPPPFADGRLHFRLAAREPNAAGVGDELVPPRVCARDAAPPLAPGGRAANVRPNLPTGPGQCQTSQSSMAAATPSDSIEKTRSDISRHSSSPCSGILRAQDAYRTRSDLFSNS